MEIFIALFFWLGISILAGIAASNKNRSGVFYFFVSILFSPLIGLVAALIATPDTEKWEQKQIASGVMKKCPHCAEVIKSKAKICRYCGKEQAGLVESQEASIGYGKCPACGAERDETPICPSCKKWVAA